MSEVPKKEEKVKSDLEIEEKKNFEEETKGIKKENQENKSKDKKENEDKKDNEEINEKKSDKEGVNKNSESQSESSKNNSDNESDSDEKENEEDEGEGEDDDLDDEDDDIDDDKSDESTSEDKKKKDPYHAYINSKIDCNFDCFENLSKGDYLYGFEKNKYYKILDFTRNSSADKFEMEIELIDNTKKTKKDKIDMKKISDNILFKQLNNKKVYKEKENKEEKNEEKKNNIESNKKEEFLKDNETKENETNKKEKENNKIEDDKKDDKENIIEDKIENVKENNENKEDNKEKEKTKNDKKTEEDSKKDKSKKGNNKKVTETISIKDYSKYTFLQKINIFYTNYLNIFHRIDMIIDINCSIDDIINRFKKLYHIPCDRYSDKVPPLNIFINGKKYSITNKTRKKFFTPNKFDYKNDYIIIIEKEIFKFKEIDIGSRSNYINLKGAKIVHYVYSSYYNLQINSFIISKNINLLECEVYEIRKEFLFDIDVENEKKKKKKVKEFLDLNWKEKANFISLIKSDYMKKSKENYNANCFEINRKFILHQGTIYIFVITASNKKLEAFNSRHISNEGLVIISRDDKSLLSGFKAKKISDLVAY